MFVAVVEAVGIHLKQHVITLRVPLKDTVPDPWAMTRIGTEDRYGEGGVGCSQVPASRLDSTRHMFICLL